MGLVISQMTQGIAGTVAWGGICGITERANRPIAGCSTGLAAVRVTWEVAGEALRGTADEMTLPMMSRIAPRMM